MLRDSLSVSDCVAGIVGSLTGDFRPIRRDKHAKVDEQKPLNQSSSPALVDDITEMSRFTHTARTARNALLRFVQGALAGVAATHAVLSYGIFASVDTYMQPAGLGVQRAFLVLSTLALLGTLDLLRFTSRSLAIATRVCTCADSRIASGGVISSLIM